VTYPFLGLAKRRGSPPSLAAALILAATLAAKPGFLDDVPPCAGRASLNIECHPSPTEVARRAADILGRVLAAKPEAVVLLPAGGTPVPLFRELVRRQAAGEVDLSRAHLFQLDELVGVSTEDPRSFHAFLRRELIEPLAQHCRREGARDHLLAGCVEDPEDAIVEHSRQLERLGGADLALLGIGCNGHVAFNEPGSQPAAQGRRVELAESTLVGLRKAFAPDELPTSGITLGLKEIGASKEIVLLATGAGKAAILSTLVQDDPSPACPASLLRERPTFLVLADEDARARDEEVDALES